MKSLITILTFMGIISVAIGYVNQLQKCPPPKIEYRYIPRTFEQDQDNPVKVSQLYHTMFTQPTPWIREMIENPSKNSEINRYFISQS
jgi:hypothetical protein